MTTTPTEPAVVPDLREQPEVQHTRQNLNRILERLTPAEEDAEHAAAVRQVLDLLEQDPTLALRSETDRMMEQVTELARQLRPLRRQVTLAPEHTRASAEHDLADMREHLRTHCRRLREQTRPDWHTAHQRRALALDRMPDPDETARTITEAADRLRSSVESALEIDPDLVEARRLLELAARIETAAVQQR